MIRTAAEACSSLSESGLEFQRYDHPPVATCEEAAKHLQGIAGAGSKNLFLRDKRGERHFLVTVREEIRVDLAKLSELFGVGRLSFASHELLERCLGVVGDSIETARACGMGRVVGVLTVVRIIACGEGGS